MSDYIQIEKKYTLKKDIKIAIIRAEFNNLYTKQLEEININFLKSKWFLNIQTHCVPGAYEIPGFVKQLQIKQKPDLILCFWVIIRGGTTHYEHVAGECFRGLMDISIDTDIQLINWVLTCENEKQVEERISHNFAVSGLNLLESIKGL